MRLALASGARLRIARSPCSERHPHPTSLTQAVLWLLGLQRRKVVPGDKYYGVTFPGNGRSKPPSDHVEYLFRTGKIARATQRWHLEYMAYVLGTDEQQVIRECGMPDLPPEPKSVVYLLAHSLRPRDGEPVKIGYTNSLAKRIEQLQPGSVQKLWLASCLEGGRQLEREIHDLLRHCRIREDWFVMCQDVREEFNSRLGARPPATTQGVEEE